VYSRIRVASPILSTHSIYFYNTYGFALLENDLLLPGEINVAGGDNYGSKRDGEYALAPERRHTDRSLEAARPLGFCRCSERTERRRPGAGKGGGADGFELDPRPPALTRRAMRVHFSLALAVCGNQPNGYQPGSHPAPIRRTCLAAWWGTSQEVSSRAAMLCVAHRAPAGAARARSMLPRPYERRARSPTVHYWSAPGSSGRLCFFPVHDTSTADHMQLRVFSQDSETAYIPTLVFIRYGSKKNRPSRGYRVSSKMQVICCSILLQSALQNWY
jgi:hypothetical protein